MNDFDLVKQKILNYTTKSGVKSVIKIASALNIPKYQVKCALVCIESEKRKLHLEDVDLLIKYETIFKNLRLKQLKQ